jgi:hypothetical protein
VKTWQYCVIYISDGVGFSYFMALAFHMAGATTCLK